MSDRDNNWSAYDAGWGVELIEPDGAFDAYRKAAAQGWFKPCVSAAVCFTAGYLGKEYPVDDPRVGG